MESMTDKLQRSQTRQAGDYRGQQVSRGLLLPLAPEAALDGGLRHHTCNGSNERMCSETMLALGMNCNSGSIARASV